MAEDTKDFLTGNEIVVKAALAAGAQFLAGYPITPTTEILKYWSEEAVKNPDLIFLQTEDEMAAGFATLGAVLAGKKAFTATAGPGNTLMQDAFSMAENIRLPIVSVIMQRGGPSTGTVIYSQQEVNLTCFGGNGEGLRIVYSTSGAQDLYDYTIKAFNIAWKYFFPTFVLGDGYQAKQLAEVELWDPAEKKINLINPIPFLLDPARKKGSYANIRNCYDLEEEISEKINHIKEIWENFASEITEFENYKTSEAKTIIFAHGIVAGAAKVAVDALREQGFRVGLFRPITLRPYPVAAARETALQAHKILVAESSLGQFLQLTKDALYGVQTPIHSFLRPALGISPEELVTEVLKMETKK